MNPKAFNPCSSNHHIEPGLQSSSLAAELGGSFGFVANIPLEVTIFRNGLPCTREFTFARKNLLFPMRNREEYPHAKYEGLHGYLVSGVAGSISVSLSGSRCATKLKQLSSITPRAPSKTWITYGIAKTSVAFAQYVGVMRRSELMNPGVYDRRSV
ncbi:hypothetical protein KC19_VG097800 [Ceratodon purpureus]|uniref:Uncharacterized protein n=1 Tax=Ceratodon purpureus TaxID=3225 RepID=A0A8T0HNQ5_CERPU|nr:hypothetical protein KC19_VG097800 [Ceratodon purpureus]